MQSVAVMSEKSAERKRASYYGSVMPNPNRDHEGVACCGSASGADAVPSARYCGPAIAVANSAWSTASTSRSVSWSNCQPTDPLGVAQVADAVAGPFADHRNGPIVLGVECLARSVHAVAVEIDVPRAEAGRCAVVMPHRQYQTSDGANTLSAGANLVGAVGSSRENRTISRTRGLTSYP